MFDPHALVVGAGATRCLANVLGNQLAWVEWRKGRERMPPSAVRAYQERVGDSIAAALAKARVPYVVMLSSIGADKPNGTGPVVGLHNLEQKLDRIPGLNSLRLRAAYFMENTLAQAGVIRQTNSAAGPLAPDLRLPMIATRDIAAAATDELLRLDFHGQQTRELLGPREYTMDEVTAIIGKAIGKPDLKYVRMPDEELRPAMVQAGMSPDMVNLLLEMSMALNSGYMRALEPRSARNTTPTFLEIFVAENFISAYQERSAA